MNRPDPFPLYSWLLRGIIYVLIPAFAYLQYRRGRNALHVFQLEGYKRKRFLQWVRDNPDRRLFMKPTQGKKPLVMTGRATRILVVTVLLSALGVLIPSGVVHITWGTPWDLITCAALFALLFFFVPHVMVFADVLLTPVQSAINARFLRAARSKLDDVAPVVIGVTGSFGKTSTKFAIQGLLGPESEVLATPGSFNTPLGVCRTINESMTSSHRYFVVEMGAYKEGDIAELCRFVRHHIGVLTAIGPAHLERFGSMEAIRRGKYEIVRDLSPGGTAVMNVDDPTVRELADGTSHVSVIRYGIDPEGSPDVTARDISTGTDGTTMTVVTPEGEQRVTTQLLGRHAIGHILAAVAVARAAGVSLGDAAARIPALEPVEHRLQIIRGAGGVTVIDDAYNSNPEGAAAALEVLDSMPAGKKLVITPGIIELGPVQAQENERFGAHAARVADTLIVVAKVNREAIVRGATGGSAEVIVVDTLAEATQRMQGLLAPGDVVLFENDLPDQYEP